MVYVETRNGWFTSNNRRGGDHRVVSRMEKSLVLEGIVNGGGYLTTTVLPFAGSNHWPVNLI